VVEVKVCGITNGEDARLAVELGASMLGFNFYPRSPRYIEPAAAAEIIAGLPANVEPVGVFVNAAVEEIVSAVAATAREFGAPGRGGIRAAQLHGDESAEFCRELRRQMPGVRLIKAFRTDAAFRPEVAVRYPAEALLVDAACNGFGGSGVQANWEAARELAQLVCLEEARLSATNYPTLTKEARVGHPRPRENENVDGAPPSRSEAELRRGIGYHGEARILPRLILAGGLTPANVAEAIRRVQPHAVDVCSGVEASKGRKDQGKLCDFFAAARTVSMADSIAT
jgi:phosphoribosylanthranilate isomerase